MKESINHAANIKKHFNNNKISELGDIKTVMNTTSTMTVYRTLSELGYISSYSHRGRYYTLTTIPNFDHNGLWSYHSVMFSKYGNLLETAASMVQSSDAGFTASELEGLLQVEVKHTLLKLFQRKRVWRSKLDSGYFVYLSADSGERRRQILLRRDCTLVTEAGKGMEVNLLPDELKAGIILFFSLLNEKQRRLYAGLEAAKLGHGGDRKIAELLGLDPHTVSKGRQELFRMSVKIN